MAIELITLFVLPTITARAFQISVGAGIIRIAAWLNNAAITNPQVDFIWQLPRWVGWHFFVGKEGSGIAVELPMWILYTCLGLLAFLLYRYSLPLPNVCGNCGYSVTTSIPVCPECGTSTAHVPRQMEKRFAFFRTRRISTIIGMVTIGLSTLSSCTTLAIEHFSRVTSIVIMPSGYRGDVVIVQDPKAPAAENGWSSLSFIVPSTGVLRVKDSSYFETREGVQIICKEASGKLIPIEGEGSGDLWFRLYGPIGDHRLVTLSIRSGNGRSDPRISPELAQEFSEHGVPANFVSPHIILTDQAAPR